MRQVRMRHGGGRGRKGRPITLREMGEKVFEELKKLMVSEILFAYPGFPLTFTSILRTTPKTEATGYDTVGLWWRSSRWSCFGSTTSPRGASSPSSGFDGRDEGCSSWDVRVPRTMNKTCFGDSIQHMDVCTVKKCHAQRHTPEWLHSRTMDDGTTKLERELGMCLLFSEEGETMVTSVQLSIIRARKERRYGFLGQEELSGSLRTGGDRLSAPLLQG